MNIVSTSNRWLNHLYKTVAILLVLLAVAISAFRLLLPYVHHYKIPLQNYLNEQAQTNMSIGSLSMTWQDFGPSLVIGDVDFITTDNASVFIKKLELQVDFWETITKQNLISKNLNIYGAKVDLNDLLWEFEKSEKAGSNAAIQNEAHDLSLISDLFLNRIKRFAILDSQVTIKNEVITRSLRLNKLHWLNTDDRHQAQGSVVVNGLSSNNLQLKLDLKGNTSRALSGLVYLQANHIDITPWLDKFLVPEDDKTKTDINFSAWLRVNNSDIERLKIDFSDSSMDWFYKKNKQHLALQKGEILLVKGKGKGNFNLYSTPLTLKLNDQPVQQFTTMLSKEVDDFSLHLSEIDLGMLSHLVPLIVAKDETRKLLSTMALRGKIEDLYVSKKNNNLQTTANFSGLNSDFSYGIPGLENVSGQLSFIDNYLSINFNAEQGQLDFDKLFIQAFPYDSLVGELSVAFDNTGWILAVEQLDFLSKEINLSAKVNVEAPVDGEVNLALLANVSNGNAALVGRYLPLPIMSDNLVEYINSAIVSGRVNDAQILINGPISHFPFVDGSGIFVVDAELSEAEFKFVESWPSITDFVANLNFTNNSMLITGRGGSLTGLDVTGVSVGIKNLTQDSILIVDADIRPTATSNITQLMNQSPLKSSVGSTLEHLQISGNVSGDFYLSLPLYKSTDSVASGNIYFDNNKAALQAPQMSFSDIQGKLSFSNDEISTQGLQLTWQGLPIALDITSGNRVDYYNTDIKLKALWEEDKWLVHIPEKLQNYMSGALPWQGKLSLYQHHEGGFSYAANFQSNLINTQLLFPAPYESNETQENALSLKLEGDASQSKVMINYNEKLHFSGSLNHDSIAFSHANLMLGDGVMALPNEGFHITTKLDYIDFSKWQPLVTDILDSIEQSLSDVEQETITPILAKPKRVRGTIGQLSILGQVLNNVSFNLLDKSQWRLLQINADETRSQIKIHPEFLAQGLEVDAEFLNFPSNEEQGTDATHLSGQPEEVGVSILAEQSSIPSTLELLEVNTTQTPIKLALKPQLETDSTLNNIVFANIPPIKFHCDSCVFGLLNLGEVDFTVKRLDNQTVEFNNFIAKRGKTQLTLTGNWFHSDEKSISSLIGRLSVNDIEDELIAMGYESIIKDSGADIDISFNWPGGLHDFSIAQVNGVVKARVDDGYLAEVSDKARIFSVLSLQSLVRKLTLDFRDIFSDGMFYSNITGEYQLKEGLLITNNTEMNGTAGNLFMTGHTNLLTGELDYDMSYKPNLTSSLPVLAWVATLNPVTFLAGVAIDQVIKSQVVSEFNFKLTGTAENPDFKEVDRKSKNITVEAVLPSEGNPPEELILDVTPPTKVLTEEGQSHD